MFSLILCPSHKDANSWERLKSSSHWHTDIWERLRRSSHMEVVLWEQLRFFMGISLHSLHCSTNFGFMAMILIRIFRHMVKKVCGVSIS